MKAVSAHCLCLFLFLGAARAGAAPSLVYSTYLGGDGRDSVVDVAVDSAGNAYILGYTSPNDSFFLAKLGPQGDLIFARRLEADYPRNFNAIAVDAARSIYIAGTLNRSEGSTGSEANEGFVIKLAADGAGISYEVWFFDGENTQGVDLAVDALGRAYVLTLSDYGWAASVNRFSPEGTLNGGTGGGSNYVVAMAVGPAGDLFTVGWVDFQSVYFERIDATSGAIIQTVLDESGAIYPRDLAGTPDGGAVVVGSTSGGLYVAGYGATGAVIFLRVLGGGEAEIRDVAVTLSGDIVLAGWTRTAGFPPGGSLPTGCTGAAACATDAFVLRLDGETGAVLSSRLLGGSQSDGANALAIGPEGDAYVAGGTASPDFPIVKALQPLRGLSDGFLARISENRPPDCGPAVATPSLIWPPNGKMVPVSILGVTDPEGDTVAIEVTRITHDEPGAGVTSSGIGTSVARVEASRDGKGDSRVYHILFEASDPSGASCAGEVTVCVPRDRSVRSCSDGGSQ